MNCRKLFTAFLILFLLSSTFVAVLHHHANTIDDHDCPICLISHHEKATVHTINAFDGVPFFVETIYITSAPAIADRIFTSFQSNRAPPV
jgi:hypothetical protein